MSRKRGDHITHALSPLHGRIRAMYFPSAVSANACAAARRQNFHRKNRRCQHRPDQEFHKERQLSTGPDPAQSEIQFARDRNDGDRSASSPGSAKNGEATSTEQYSWDDSINRAHKIKKMVWLAGPFWNLLRDCIRRFLDARTYGPQRRSAPPKRSRKSAILCR